MSSLSVSKHSNLSQECQDQLWTYCLMVSIHDLLGCQESYDIFFLCAEMHHDFFNNPIKQ